jgi:hypothetical protein
MTANDLRCLPLGTRVRKVSGDYQWDGVLSSVFMTPSGDCRCVVAHPVERGWVLHIYAPINVEKCEGPPDE